MNPIFIHKGDCTIFAHCKRFLNFNIETNIDLSGYNAKFILGLITKEISDISSKSFGVVLSSEDTKQLKIGIQYGSIILIDNEGNIKTITNTIPFQVTNEVIENEYQEIDLTIPETSGIDIKLKVGAQSVISINGMNGEVILTAQDIGALPDTTIIPDISNLATKQELTSGLATKQPNGDYALKSDIPSLDDCVKTTDYATSSKAGVMRPANGLFVSGTTGAIVIACANTTQIDAKTDKYYPIVPYNLNYAVNSVLPTMTQAEYDALETKDENLFYMIVEE